MVCLELSGGREKKKLVSLDESTLHHIISPWRDRKKLTRDTLFYFEFFTFFFQFYYRGRILRCPVSYIGIVFSSCPLWSLLDIEILSNRTIFIDYGGNIVEKSRRKGNKSPLTGRRLVKQRGSQQRTDPLHMLTETQYLRVGPFGK